MREPSFWPSQQQTDSNRRRFCQEESLLNFGMFPRRRQHRTRPSLVDVLGRTQAIQDEIPARLERSLHSRAAPKAHAIGPLVSRISQPLCATLRAPQAIHRDVRVRRRWRLSAVDRFQWRTQTCHRLYLPHSAHKYSQNVSLAISQQDLRSSHSFKR